jgi:quinol monooxygenase YgiN
MSRFGLFGKIITHAGKRDEFAELLLEAAKALESIPGCELYVVSISPTEPNAILVTEVWKSAEDHKASLALESTRAAIERGRPLIAGFEQRTEFQPLGGKGLRENTAVS